MTSSKKKNKRPRRLLEEAAIYSEDVGTLGIKKTAGGGASSFQKPILSLPLPDDEDKRRLQRMVNSCCLELVMPGPVSHEIGLLLSHLGTLRRCN